MNTTNTTLPTLAELQDAGFMSSGIEATEFCFATGAISANQEIVDAAKHNKTAGTIPNINPKIPARVFTKNAFCVASKLPNAVADTISVLKCTGITPAGTPEIVVTGARANLTGVAMNPIFHNIKKTGIRTTEYMGKTCLAINDMVALYPQTAVPDDENAKIQDIINEKSLHSYSNVTIYKFPGTRKLVPESNFRHQYVKISYLHCYNVGGVRYARMAGSTLEENLIHLDEIFTAMNDKKKYLTGRFFKIEPVEVVELKSGDIMCKQAHVMSIVSDGDGLRKRMKTEKIRPGDEIDFPNDGEMINQSLFFEFNGNLERLAGVTKIHAPTADEVKAEKHAAGERVRLKKLKGLFRAGDKVVLKYEGHRGIVFKVDEDHGLTTVNINGKLLKYRTEDLSPEISD